jgi:hypothetical protein
LGIKITKVPTDEGTFIVSEIWTDSAVGIVLFSAASDPEVDA